MPTTTMTCRGIDAPREVEKLVRRWAGHPLVLTLTTGGVDTTIAVSYPQGVSSEDPGPSEIDIALADALVALGAAQHEVIDLRERLARAEERGDSLAQGLDACERARAEDRAAAAAAAREVQGG